MVQQYRTTTQLTVMNGDVCVSTVVSGDVFNRPSPSEHGLLDSAAHSQNVFAGHVVLGPGMELSVWPTIEHLQHRDECLSRQTIER